MLAVVDSVEWRRVLDTTVSGTPAVMEMVAARWRGSWTVEAGRQTLDHPAQSRSGGFGGGVVVAADVVAPVVGEGMSRENVQVP
ncbi:hypothetical protein ACWEQL_01820 [Kitasatospora sp. NPDC004240]